MKTEEKPEKSSLNSIKSTITFIVSVFLLVVLPYLPTSAQNSDPAFSVDGCNMSVAAGQIEPQRSGAPDNLPVWFRHFWGVSKVAIFVDYTEVPAGDIPEVISKKNLEKILKSLYLRRFTPIADYDMNRFKIITEGCYERNNQEVHVFDFSSEQDKVRARKISLDEDTLTSYLKLRKIDNSKAYFRFVQYRPHLYQPFWRSLLGIPTAFYDVEPKDSPKISKDFDIDLNQEEAVNFKFQKWIATRIQ